VEFKEYEDWSDVTLSYIEAEIIERSAAQDCNLFYFIIESRANEKVVKSLLDNWSVLTETSKSCLNQKD